MLHCYDRKHHDVVKPWDPDRNAQQVNNETEAYLGELHATSKVAATNDVIVIRAFRNCGLSDATLRG